MAKKKPSNPPENNRPGESNGDYHADLNKVDAAALLAAAAAKERGRIGRFNLAIVGGTGVGKSSLVNAIFDEPRAATGVGLPVTAGVSYYQSDSGSLGVWDFEGFEIGTD